MAQVTIVLDTHQEDDAAMLQRLMGNYDQHHERTERGTEAFGGKSQPIPNIVLGEPEGPGEEDGAWAEGYENRSEPAAPETPADPGVDVDADGRPWDSRIDSSSRKKNQTDGRWAKRRGVGDDYRRQIIAELQGQTAPEQPPEQDPAATFGTTEPTAGDHGTPQPPTAPAGTTGTDHDSVDFPTFMQRLTGALQAGTIDQQTVHREMLEANGVSAMPQLAQNPALIPIVSRKLEELTGA